MKKIYLLIPYLALGFYFTSAQKPVANFFASDDTLCVNGCPNFTDSSTNNPTSWLWTFQGASLASSSEQNPSTVCFLNTGNFSVKLVVSNSSGSDSVSKPILVYSVLPFPPINLSYDTLFIYIDSSYAAYKWYVDSIVISGATDTFYVVVPHGLCPHFNVAMVDTITGCGSGLGVICSGINNLSGEKEIIVYPTPASNQLTVHSSYYDDEDLMISIRNVLGELLKKEKLRWSKDIFLDIADLPAGIYFLQLETTNGRIIKKFVKE